MTASMTASGNGNRSADPRCTMAMSHDREHLDGGRDISEDLGPSAASSLKGLISAQSQVIPSVCRLKEFFTPRHRYSSMCIEPN